MARMSFPYACARLREYFLPAGFEAVLDSPTSMTARVFDPSTGEELAVVTGLTWSTAITNVDLVGIIGALEEEMQGRKFLHEPRAGTLTSRS